MFADFIEVHHKDHPKQQLKLSIIWLRDHCRCKECFNNSTKQRLLDLTKFPKDLKATKVVEKTDGQLLVQWSDGHESEYSFQWLWKSQVQNTAPKIPMKSWTKASIEKENYANIPLNDLLSSEEDVKKVLESLITYGVAFINKVPPTTDMTEMAIRRMFPLMKTLFGEMFTFMDNPDHADTAYSKDFLGSHTDNTYFTDAAGLQILHCIHHNGTGGESTLADGLKCIEELREKNHEAFALLTRVQIPAEYIDEEKQQHHYHSGPVIDLCPVTGELKQFRWNVYDRAVMDTIPQEDMPKFYEAFIELAKIIESEKNRWVFKLTPGTIVIFNNWRVMHGRESYTGIRKMTGCYVLYSEFISKAKSLGLM